MKKRFLIFALSLLLLCGFILARDFYIINKRKTIDEDERKELHKNDCCSGCKSGESCLTVCLPCCDKDNNIWNVILLKKKYNKTMEDLRGWLPCYDF